MDLFLALFFSFVYNKIYIKELLIKGYKPANETAKNILAEKSIISA